MIRILKKITALFILFLICIGSVYASHWIYSNIVKVEVGGYDINLSWNIEGNQVTLNASLTQNANPKPNVEVTFFECDNVGSILNSLGTNTTNLNGYAFYSFTSTNGTHYYKAGYESP